MDTISPIATDTNHTVNLNNSNTHLYRGSFYETAQTVANSNFHLIEKTLVVPMTSNRNGRVLNLPQRFERLATERIQKKIKGLNNDIFRNSRHLSTLNAPVFDKKQQSDMTRDILSMSPLMKRKDYYLSDIMKNSYTNNSKKKAEVNKNESAKQIKKREDDQNMKEFMNKFANPTYWKFICGKVKNEGKREEKKKTSKAI